QPVAPAPLPRVLAAPPDTRLPAPGRGPRPGDDLERQVVEPLLQKPGSATADDRPILPLVSNRAVERALHALSVRTVGQFLATPKERMLQFKGIGRRTWQRLADAVARSQPGPTLTASLLPDSLRSLSLHHAALPAALLSRLEDLGCTTVGHALSLPPSAWTDGGDLGPHAAEALRRSLDQLFRAALEQIDTRAAETEFDWPTLRGR